MRERRIGRDDLDQALVEHVDIGGEPSDAAARKTLQHRIFEQSRGILGGDFLGAELAANSKHLDQPFNRRRVTLRRACRHDGDERCDHAGIERIVLRQNPTRFGELPQLERIDLAHRHAGREQRTHDTTLVATTRLDADRRDHHGSLAARPRVAARGAAQQAERMRRIGVLTGTGVDADDADMQARFAAFAQALQQLGWTDGRNVQIDYRLGCGRCRTTFANTRPNWPRSRRTSSWTSGTATVAPIVTGDPHRADRVRRASSIRSAPASSKAWRGRAATPPDLSCSNTA